VVQTPFQRKITDRLEKHQLQHNHSNVNVVVLLFQAQLTDDEGGFSGMQKRDIKMFVGDQQRQHSLKLTIHHIVWTHQIGSIVIVQGQHQTFQTIPVH
jgi:hypothetical protein